MQYVHFDLQQIERDVRKMYATTPGEFIHPDPDVVAIFRQSADIEVAFVNWFFSNQMRGVPAHIQMEAIVHIVSTLIMNRVRSIASDNGDGPVLDFVMNGVIDTVSQAFASDRDNGPSPHAIAVSAVTSGRA